MSKLMSNQLSIDNQASPPEWDRAISDAREEIVNLHVQVKRLRRAIRTFAKNKKEDTPWPSIDLKLED